MSVQLSKLLTGLDDSQYLAITSDLNPLAILAGAGSGKTRVLTRRIAYRIAEHQVDPARIMAVTFTRKAAGELRHRLRQLGIRDGITTGTFHALAYAQLHERWAQKGIRPPEMIKGKFGWIARLLGRNAPRSLIADTLHELDWITARNITFDQYPLELERSGRSAPIEVDRLEEIAKRFKEEKLKRRVIDFNDLLSLALRDVTRDEQYAAVLRWRHRHIFVDEFQDVNPLQFRLLRAWCGDDLDLCVVGDPNQAIYGWNGADSWPLRRFEHYFEGAGTVKLGFNYRSTPEIIEAGHAVLPRPDREAETPKTTNPSGSTPSINIYEDDQAEALGLARSIRDAAGPKQAWSQQAILVRTNAQVAVIAAALEKAKIPHRVRGQAQLTEQPEVRELLDEMQKDNRLLSDTTKLLSAAIDEAGNSEDTDSVVGADRQRNRQALLRLALDHASSHPDSKTFEFVNWLYATASKEAIEVSSNVVEIMTFHSSKGLEWNRVYIAGCEQGYLPIAQAKGPAALSEERRLFHVAITRARKYVNISWAKERTFGQKSQRRQPSPYLNHLEPQDNEADSISAGEKAALDRRSISKHRSAQRSVSPEDAAATEQRLTVLRKWRRLRAQRDGVPAYVVFNNVTLEALAEQNPTQQDQLFAIRGLGEKRVERYGAEILATLAEVADS